MKTSFQIAFCFLIVSFTDKIPICDKLSDGKYKVHFDESFKQYEDYKIEINRTSYMKYLENGDSVKGKFEWIYNCSLRFDSGIKVNLDSMTEFEKLVQKSFGNSIVKLEDIHGDTINFRTTYSGNLHITLNQGKLIRLK